MIIGSLGDINFVVSSNELASINDSLKRKYSAKISEHNPVYGVGMLRHQGRQLIEVSFSISLISTLNENILEVKNKLIESLELGKVDYLVIGGQVVGSFPFLITEIDEENSYFNRQTGLFDKIDINVTLKEYVENPKEYNESLTRKKLNKNISDLSTENITDITKEQGSVVL